VFESSEECDPTSPEWKNSGGACDQSCKLTSAAYKACGLQGASCWTGSPTGYFCSLVGTCTRACATNNDCPPSGSCVADPGAPSQRICTTQQCQAGETLQWYGTQGCLNGKATLDPSTGAPYPQCQNSFVPVRMCGWVSADPTMQKLWCPAEVSGDCCPPSGVNGTCVPH
jgi:hypothetical protein